jgi:hypothetical protein
MFGQLLPNKNKITTVWRAVYYVKFASKVWYLNKALMYAPSPIKVYIPPYWYSLRSKLRFFSFLV